MGCMEKVWKKYGKSMGNVWTMYGKSMENVWQMYGKWKSMGKA